MEISISTPTLHHEKTQPHRAFITRDLRAEQELRKNNPPSSPLPFFLERMLYAITFVLFLSLSLSLSLSMCALYVGVFLFF
jgi:hypothetical protein